jgi:hypothetical protein
MICEAAFLCANALSRITMTAALSSCSSGIRSSGFKEDQPVIVPRPLSEALALWRGAVSGKKGLKRTSFGRSGQPAPR